METYNNLLPKVTNYRTFTLKTKAKKSHINEEIIAKKSHIDNSITITIFNSALHYY